MNCILIFTKCEAFFLKNCGAYWIILAIHAQSVGSPFPADGGKNLPLLGLLLKIM
jgi:hypothetical protein